MSATVRCVLCRRADRPMTREHVFARWLIARVHGAKLVSSRAATPDPRIARVIAPVCADCNAGWMSGLEVGFRRTVFARPRAGAVQPPERTLLSRWFTKSAVLVADANGLSLGSIEHRPAVVAGMPADIEVFVARLRRPRQAIDFVLVPGEADEARAVAISVRDLVGHVAVRGTLTSRHGTRLWPLRTHALRWETLPVISGLG